ncbi:hypothetical protein RC74_10110 [Falsihalocynthiibacter arcticus]|uniref:Amino acid decarboxylase n=2 Tax=Falsihalocynthiibacter arcticus TaxID=1579316 RepID=A0A126V1K5_9RHOB|nr:hypothetical protein RC74_10110 [Falsihalocynthiibacter arcticus]
MKPISNLGKMAQDLAEHLSDRPLMARLMAGHDAASLSDEVIGAITQMLNALDNSMSNPDIDDVMGRGDGPIRALSELVAQCYNVERAIITPHGSSLNNIVLALAIGTICGPDAHVLVDRGCHASVTGGLTLAHVRQVSYLNQPFDQDVQLRRPLSPEVLDAALTAAKTVQAVWITNPSYDGFMIGDIAALRRVCDDHGARLIVDAAWGALQGLLSDAGFPETMVTAAHAGVMSLHKSGIGLSGMSVALFNDEALAAEFMRFADIGLISTSPPFLLYCMVEQTVSRWLAPEGQSLAKQLQHEAQSFAEALDALPGVSLVRPEHLGPGIIVDPTHILIDVRGTGLLGYDILEAFAAHYGKDLEKATLSSLLFLFGSQHVEAWPEIVSDLGEIIERGGRIGQPVPKLCPPPEQIGTTVMPLHEAQLSRHRQALPDEAVGMIAAQPVSAYPPGSALLQPGEVIRQDVVDYLRAVQAAGSRLKGIAGNIDTVGLTVVDRNPTHNNSN